MHYMLRFNKIFVVSNHIENTEIISFQSRLIKWYNRVTDIWKSQHTRTMRSNNKKSSLHMWGEQQKILWNLDKCIIVHLSLTGFGNWIRPDLSCWLLNSSLWLLNSSLWLLNSSLWHENLSVTRLAAGVNTKTRCSSCVIILFKYNCCKQLLRRQ